MSCVAFSVAREKYTPAPSSQLPARLSPWRKWRPRHSTWLGLGGGGSRARPGPGSSCRGRSDSPPPSPVEALCPRPPAGVWVSPEEMEDEALVARTRPSSRGRIAQAVRGRWVHEDSCIRGRAGIGEMVCLPRARRGVERDKQDMRGLGVHEASFIRGRAESGEMVRHSRARRGVEREEQAVRGLGVLEAPCIRVTRRTEAQVVLRSRAHGSHQPCEEEEVGASGPGGAGRPRSPPWPPGAASVSPAEGRFPPAPPPI